MCVYIGSLGGKLVLMLIRAGILFFLVVVEAVGIISFGKRSFLVMEVEYLRVVFGLVGGDIFNLDGDFVGKVVELEVEGLELVGKAVVRLAWDCLNGRMYLL